MSRHARSRRTRHLNLRSSSAGRPPRLCVNNEEGEKLCVGGLVLARHGTARHAPQRCAPAAAVPPSSPRHFLSVARAALVACFVFQPAASLSSSRPCARVSVRARARVMCALPITAVAEPNRGRRDRGGRTPPCGGLDPVRRLMKLKAFKRMFPPRRKVGGASIRLNSVEFAVHVGLIGGSDGWSEKLRDREVIVPL